METLQISKENAVKAFEATNAKGKKLLSNLFGKNVFIKNIRERIQTIQDIFELNNTTEEAFNEKWNGFELHEKANAFEILIVAAYCGGGMPDFTDDTRKYYPRFVMGSPSGVGFSYDVFVYWYSFSYVGARLVFHGPEAYENMIDAVEKFLPQYQQSRTT
ncbi:hypothetical protein FLJC2902T_17240 [Flavobacterium limnosediminis JC2902]|uniref:Uncharacterized protein n=1 Tax=Flavobacterium limnosediminis JC2902 TaxID=1341181 RepID=V6SNV0_9FLAO|nr:hypothetical protein [Flavobacterium limnosediminis]ESU28373.1 hypothetical protein FLJC2902T_17240 [Flavobacterium limnosediminis JC2902]